MREAENRLCGLSFEPGVFQIILVYTMLMWIKEMRHFVLPPTILLKLLICLLALLATQSTMGYFGLIALMGAIIFTTEKLKAKTVRLILAGGVFLVSLSYFVLSGDVVQNKLNEEGGNMSYTVRLMDNIAAWRIFIENPIFGAGIETPYWESLANQYRNITASNGGFEHDVTNKGVLDNCLYTCIPIECQAVCFWHQSPLLCDSSTTAAF